MVSLADRVSQILRKVVKVLVPGLIYKGSNNVSSTIFKVFGMMTPGIEYSSPRPLANTLPTKPIEREREIKQTERGRKNEIEIVRNRYEGHTLDKGIFLKKQIIFKKNFFSININSALFGISL